MRPHFPGDGLKVLAASRIWGALDSTGGFSLPLHSCSTERQLRRPIGRARFVFHFRVD